MKSAPTLAVALAWGATLFAGTANAQQKDPEPTQRPLLQDKRVPPAIQPSASEHLRRALLDPMRPSTQESRTSEALATPLRKRVPALVFVGSADIPVQATTSFSPIRMRTSALVAVGSAELPDARDITAFVPVRKRTSALVFIGTR